MLADKSQYEYQPFFCEENVWQLAKRVFSEKEERLCVLFFINSQQSVLMTQQLAFGDAVYGSWDYHVVLCLPNQKLIVDFDSGLGFETTVEDYFRCSFPELGLGDEELDKSQKTIVRSIAVTDYLEFFCSDRSHMIDCDGKRMAEFPSWPEIKCDSNALPLVDLRESSYVDSRFEDQSISEFLASVN